LNPGDVFWADPRPVRGSEQDKTRPWVVVSRRETNGQNTVIAVPLTSRGHKAGPPYRIQIPRTEFLKDAGTTATDLQDSIALCDQIRVLDKSRITFIYGKLTRTAVNAIQLGLTYIFDIR
jgi:mRNA interferase MazF